MMDLTQDGNGIPQLPVLAEDALEWLCTFCHAEQLKKGWGTDPDGSVPGPHHLVPRALLLMHSEISEAMEEIRKPGIEPSSIYLSAGAKPEGFVVELADLLIRVFDLCGRYRLPLAKAMALKLDHNRTRPPRHGGKRF